MAAPEVTLSNLDLATLPMWVKEFRPHQVTAIREILEHYEAGAKVVIVDAPTGSGKSLIAECVRRLLRVPSIYVCTTRTLQDQVERDFGYYHVIKGRSNYLTEFGGDSVTCEDCTWRSKDDGGNGSCMWCNGKDTCPYSLAKRGALGIFGEDYPRDVAGTVLNAAYYLTETQHAGGFRGKPFVILDEADTIESQLMGHIEVHISTARMKRYRWKPPDRVLMPDDDEVKAAEVAAGWITWIKDRRKQINERLAKLERAIHRKPVTSDIREARYLEALHDSLVIVESDLAHCPREWAYTGTDTHHAQPVAAWRPVFVTRFGHNLLWSKADRFLAMSATIVDPAEMMRSTGCNLPWAVVRVPSTFPVANRPIYSVPVASMTHKTTEEAWPKMATGVRKICEIYPAERILIHAVSYKLTAYLAHELASLPRPIYTYTNANERNTALEHYLAAPDAVLIAPSMDRGYDFADDAARVQILVKMPYPSLGDRQVKARLRAIDGQMWYTLQTVRSIVQMTGRSIRSEDDHALTFILDSQFMSNIYPKAHYLFPPWWVEAVNTWPPPELMHLLSEQSS